MLTIPHRSGAFFVFVVYLTHNCHFFRETYCQQDILLGRSWRTENQQTRTSNHEIAQNETRAKRLNRAVSNKGKENNDIRQDECYDDFITDCLQTHDMYRAMHRVPPLEANTKLMDYAKQRANELAITNVLAHPAHSAYGENLAFSSQKDSTCSDLIEMWYDEERLYNWRNPNFNTAIGHFSQLVWRDSARIGCARSFSNRGVYLVCNYDPPGNVMGQFRKQVTPPKRGPKESIPPANSYCPQTDS